ncbi:MAG: hypothetical protein H7222_12795 [Methylotenera sp.]|nr:hypothetical protein [Oligoflexia bacterium]
MKNQQAFAPFVALGLFAVFSGLSAPVASADPREWNENNDPSDMLNQYEARLDQLPTSATLPAQKMPWSDSYWPSKQGGIAARWFQKNASSKYSNFNYYSPNLAELHKMTSEEVALLSPAEKYDIYRGKYNYPLVARERDRTGPDSKSWEGICHGWSAASMLHAEPVPVTVVNADGIAIPFGSSDVKALMSLFYAHASDNEVGNVVQLGARCEKSKVGNLLSRHSDEDCADTNPGTFHLALGNLIGKRQTGFIAELDDSRQVWNHPVMGYQSTLGKRARPSRKAAPSAVSEVEVKTVVSYIIEINPTWEAVLGTPNEKSKTIEYRYTLELDGQGAIVGGEWLSSGHPDFIWTLDRLDFNRADLKEGDIDFSGITGIYKTR